MIIQLMQGFYFFACSMQAESAIMALNFSGMVLGSLPIR